MSIQYAGDHFTLEVKRKTAPICDGRQRDGYGRKIATDYVVRLDGKGPWRRVYVVCFSNAGSAYVVVHGQNYYLRDYEMNQ